MELCWDEEQERNVTGCHAIDHVQSIGECKAIRKRPFVCIKRSEAEARGIDVVTRWPQGHDGHDGSVLCVFSQTDLSRQACVPHWTGSECHLDLEAEHENLVSSSLSRAEVHSNKASTTPRSTHCYYTKEDEEEETMPLINPDDRYGSAFCSFYVISRMTPVAIFTLRYQSHR